MHDYMTRQMVALQPMTYAGWPVEAGDPFLATPIDGDYFIRCKRAKDAAPTAAPVAPLPVQDPAPADGRIINELEAITPPAADAAAPADAPVAAPAAPARRTYTRRTPAAAPADPSAD